MRGAIVKIEENEIYVNLGSSKRLEPGSPLRVKRPLVLRHPVSGARVVDWLPVGATRISAVGTQLSMARVSDRLLTEVAVGDAVEILVAGDPPPPAPTAVEPDEPDEPDPDEPPPEPLPTVDAETRTVLDIWRGNLGRPIAVRIAAWELFLANNPDSQYTAAITDDVAMLQAQRERIDGETSLDDGPALGGLQHVAPKRIERDAPVPLVFLIDEPDDLLMASLHYRQRGKAYYRRIALDRDGDLYLRGALPASVAHAPGVEYFVEIVSHEGGAGFGAGTPADPIAIDVPAGEITEVFTERRNRSRVSITGTFLDYATFDDRSGDRTDQVFLFEADFFYRLYTRLYGIRAGFGVISGEGGFADDRLPTQVGFNFGFAELEFRGPADYAYIGRIVAGVGDDGFGLGVEARLRLGRETGDNLSFGFSKIDQIGFLTDIRMQWNAFSAVPLGFAVALTDQPSEGDLGVRLTTDIGWRVTDWVQPTLRLSYQGRTVTHSGVGGGLGLVFDW